MLLENKITQKIHKYIRISKSLSFGTGVKQLISVHDYYNYYYYYYYYYYYIIIGISFMQSVYTYIPERNHIPKEHCVAAILMLLFMVRRSLVLALTPSLRYHFLKYVRSVQYVIIIIIIIRVALASLVSKFIMLRLLARFNSNIIQKKQDEKTLKKLLLKHKII
jgi:hypothetical protein